MLIKIDTNEYPISEKEFKNRFPNIAFPNQINYQDYGYAVVFPSPQPEKLYNQSVRETTPELTDKGWYEQRWEVVNLSDTMTSEEYQEWETNYLNNIKSEKLKLIQTKKNEMRDAGFIVDDIKFDSDIAARLAYTELGLQLQANPEFTTMWKASDGVWVTMNYALYQQVITAGKAHIESCFAWQAAKEQEIDAATTIEELDAVEI